MIIPSGLPACADWSYNVKYCFADHTLDTERRELYRGSEPIAVEPQVFDLLIYLMENRDRVRQQGRSHRFGLGRPNRLRLRL